MKFIKCRQNTRRSLKCAFSLVEMLMALLVASLLMAALAPVMTKRFGEDVNVSVSGGATPKTYCIYSNDTTEELILNEENTACLVPDNTYSASAIIASGGGGGAGAANSVSGSRRQLVENQGISGAETDKVYKENIQNFDKYTKDIVIKMSSGGGGGGGGYYALNFDRPRKQSDCEPFGVYVSKEQNGGNSICVSKYNPSQYTYKDQIGFATPAIPASVRVFPANSANSNTTDCNTSNQNCCWVSKLINDTSSAAEIKMSTNCHDSVGAVTYSGCYRTACQWKAANTVCNNWNPLSNGTMGRLPSYNEMSTWQNKKILNTTGSNPGILNWNPDTSPAAGLQLCDYNTDGSSTVRGLPLCDNGASNTCVNSGTGGGGGCSASSIWTKDTDSTGAAYYGGNQTGVFKVRTYFNTRAYGLRCVVDKGRLFDSYLGSNGTSGNYLEVSVPENIINLAAANNNARIRTLAGAGGNGGKAKSAENGINGSASWVGIYDGNNLLWAVLLPGGKAGKGASKTSDGSPADTVSNICTYYDSTNSKYNNPNGVNINCNNIPGRKTFIQGGTAPGDMDSDITSFITAGGAGSTCSIADKNNEVIVTRVFRVKAVWCPLHINLLTRVSAEGEEVPEQFCILKISRCVQKT